MSQAAARAPTVVRLSSRAACRQQRAGSSSSVQHAIRRQQQQWRAASKAEHPADHPPVVLKTGDEGEGARQMMQQVHKHQLADRQAGRAL